MPERLYLRFGIPSLDDLFGSTSLHFRSAGVQLKEAKENTKVAIIGPDGSGKSLLALHLASRYLADQRSNGCGQVIYLSTDLTHGKADRLWNDFSLDRPNLREVPFYRGSKFPQGSFEIDATEIALQLILANTKPISNPGSSDSDSLAESLAGPKRDQLHFLDFVNCPVGDIWSFANRLLAVLDEPQGARHLVIVDHLAGFDTMGGDFDAFGERSSMRARLMQMLQAAGKKCHLLFLTEEGHAGEAPLTDISDVLIRLRHPIDQGYRTRTIEIEKARAQAIQRGQHHIFIRTGLGSTTGVQENPDDPRTTNAYVMVVPSLHSISRRVMNEPSSSLGQDHQGSDRFAGFGLPNLDELIGGSVPPAPGPLIVDHEGLAPGGLSAVVGDSNTHKTALGHQFLLRGFELFAKNLAARVSPDKKVPALSYSGSDLKVIKMLLAGAAGTDARWSVESLTKILTQERQSDSDLKVLRLCLGEWVQRILVQRLRSDWVEKWSSGFLEKVLPSNVPGDAELKSFLQGTLAAKEMATAFASQYWIDWQYYDKEEWECRHRTEAMLLEAQSGAARTEAIRGRVSAVRRGGEVLAAAAGAEGFVSSTPNTGDSAEVIWRSRLFGLNALDFFTRMFGGSAWLLNAGDRSLLREIEMKSDQRIPESVGIRLAQGIGEANVRSKLQEGQREPAALAEWLESVLGWDGKLSNLQARMAEFSPPPPPPPPNTPGTDHTEPLKLGWADRLLLLSPRTHPFCESTGAEALRLEMTAWDGNDGTCPIFCSAMVAACLGNLRRGRFERREHDPPSDGDSEFPQDELKRRSQGARTLVGLREWVGKAIQQANDLALSKNSVESDIERILTWLESPVGGEYSKYAKNLEREAFDGGSDGPAVLIATGNFSYRSLERRYKKWLDAWCRAQQDPKIDCEAFREAALRHLREWLIVRRLEVHYLATSSLSAIIRRCVEAAQERLSLDQRDRTAWKATVSRGIRLVIDGLAALKQTYPNVLADPVFLPQLKFYVNRENLTALVVASQSGRPDARGEDEFERETQDLFLKQIRTWRVPFFGQHRVAITVLPPAAPAAARVREIRDSRTEGLVIDRHFELYQGLDSGSPRSVSLEVRLFGGTKNWAEYQGHLGKVLGEIFPFQPDAGFQTKPLSVAVDHSPDWLRKLKDFGRLHRGGTLDCTVLFMVDEFWCFQRSHGLRRQKKYLTESLEGGKGGGSADPLEIFQATAGDSEAAEATHTRGDRFELTGHRENRITRLSDSELASVDRVPFLWDFGFLACNRAAWANAGNELLHVANERYMDDEATGEIKVDQIWRGWNRMGQPEKEKPRSFAHKPWNGATIDSPARDWVSGRSWRLFLEAAQVVAGRHALTTGVKVPAFDMSIRGGGSLACLILEVWASEVFSKYWRNPETRELAKGPYFANFAKRQWNPTRTSGLVGLLAEPSQRGSLKSIYAKAAACGELPYLYRHSMEAFKAFLLLREAMDFSSLIDSIEPFGLKSRPVNSEAIAARHWYHSVCDSTDSGKPSTDYDLAQLPGHFSVRGDWFLAVAQGSQSDLLADRALDVLSSRRGNAERLKLGLGLPVRDVTDPSDLPNRRTRLYKLEPDGTRAWVRYGELKDLGADPESSVEKLGNHPFSWLWRSALGDFDAQSRVLQQGVIWMVHWWSTLQNVRGTAWKTGFHLYDAIDAYYATPDTDEGLRLRRKIFDENFAVRSLWEFPEICDTMIAALKKSTPRRDR